jgi:extracellular factor (EF) 3-hydroxypalmitic acid methyl ester biosynthesis protein
MEGYMKHYDAQVDPQNSQNYSMSVSDIMEPDGRKKLLNTLLPYSKTMHCRQGMDIIIGGMESAGFYYVSTGAVEVSYTSGAAKIVVALIGAGHFFGESGFFDKGSRIRDIRAVEDADIHTFDEEALSVLQQKNPWLYGHLMMVIAQSLSQKFRRILDEREPLTAYAMSLSTGRRTLSPDDQVPYDFMNVPEGLKARNRIDAFFKFNVFELSCMLQKDTGPAIPETLQLHGAELFDEFNGILDELDTLNLDDNVQASLWQYVFKEAFPYVMRSRIAERSYFKPKGYAGDFMTIEMLYRNTPEGDGKIGTMVDAWCLDSPAARAVRGRRKLLTQQLDEIGRSVYENQGAVAIMNLACGPCRELADYIGHCGYSEAVRALCVDIDPDALAYAHSVFAAIDHKAHVSMMQENLIKWCLGRVDHDFGLQDIIYSSGLMDYLDDMLFKAMINRCYDQLSPGGVLMLGNFSPLNSIRRFMDHILDWKLIHRSEEDLVRLFDDSFFKGHVTIIGEEQGINLFAKAQKPV